MPLTFRMPSRTAFIVAVTSGKGGVGKTSVAVHLAVALARLGRRVGLFDADLALGTIDVRLGLTPARHIGAVLDGDRSVDDITLAGPCGIDVIPAASGVRELTALTSPQWARLAGAIARAASGRDFLIVDTAPGVGDTVIEVVGLADYALVVTSQEPAALVDAYAMIKLITAADGPREIGVLVNAAREARQAERVFAQIARAASRFLGRALCYDGFIPDDPRLRDASLDQAWPAVVSSAAARSFERLATRLAARPHPDPDPEPGASSVTCGGGRRRAALAEAARCA